MFKSRIRWPENVTRMCEIINAYKIIIMNKGKNENTSKT
jgi:hypothetical protein